VNSEPSQEVVEEARGRVAVRDLIAWFISSLIGSYLGFQAGLMIESSLILLVSGIIGWVLGGIGGLLLLSLFIRSTPHRTVSLRTASSAVLGSMIGGLTGGFISHMADLSEVIGALLGAIFGFVAGWLIGTASTNQGRNKGEASKN
jgi:hypothetical protein